VFLAVLVVVVGADAGDEGAGDLILAGGVEDGWGAGDGLEEGVVRVVWLIVTTSAVGLPMV